MNVKGKGRVVASSRLLLCSIVLAGLSGAASAGGKNTPIPLMDVINQSNIVSYGGSNANFFNGTNINNFIGANTYYGAGYTGTRAIAANVEGGGIWNGHLVLTKVTTYVDGTGALTGSAAWQEHATGVGGIIAGFLNNSNLPDVTNGIAYGATLWGSNLATGFGGGGSFSDTDNTVYSSYFKALKGGVNGKTADVSNSSWGFSSGNLANQQTISAGFVLQTVAIDALIAETHKLSVFSAGNSGTAGGNQVFHNVSGIGAGFNTLVVGSSGPNGTYTGRSSFSSFGPNSYYNPNTGAITDGVRARVDILAPGEEIDMPDYTGNVSQTGAYWAASGTSMAAPAVAGAASLLVDAARDKGYANGADNRVLSAVLMNSATKLNGWTNNAATVSGNWKTTQALDFQQGAGQVNLKKGFDQQNAGTTDVAGLGGGTVKSIGWDFGQVSDTAATDYLIDPVLLAGSNFTATLVWNEGAKATGDASGVTGSSVGVTHLSDLDLQLWTSNAGVATDLVAESNAGFINREHINFTIGKNYHYILRVKFLGQNYNFDQHANSEAYGLAWYGTPAAVPEPASMAVLGLGFMGLVLRRRRK